MATATVAAPITVEQEQCLVLGAISWEQYEAVLRGVPRAGRVADHLHRREADALVPEATA